MELKEKQTGAGEGNRGCLNPLHGVESVYAREHNCTQHRIHYMELKAPGSAAQPRAHTTPRIHYMELKAETRQEVKYLATLRRIHYMELKGLPMDFLRLARSPRESITWS